MKITMLTLAIVTGLFPGLLGGSGNAVELAELANPAKITVFKDTLLVSEKTRVLVYSLSTGRLIRKFGKPGEGPGEFKLGHGETGVKLDVNTRHILVNSAAKLTYYSHAGIYQKEIKVPPLHHFIPLGNRFVSSTRVNKNGRAYQAVYLFSGNGKRLRELLLTDILEGMGVKIYAPPYNFKYCVYENHAYVASAKAEILINVFDEKGRKVTEIRVKCPEIPLTEKYEEEIKKDYQLDPRTKSYWGYFKHYLTFPRYFPALRDFFIDRGLLYFQTYQKKGNQLRWIICDLRGKEITKVWLPAFDFYSSQPSLHSIANHRYYFLTEKEANDGWLLNRIVIE